MKCFPKFNGFQTFSVLKSTFDAFDVDRKGYIEAEMVGTIMDILGTHVLADELDVSLN